VDRGQDAMVADAEQMLATLERDVARRAAPRPNNTAPVPAAASTPRTASAPGTASTPRTGSTTVREHQHPAQDPNPTPAGPTAAAPGHGARSAEADAGPDQGRSTTP
jgi:macrolide phosphotransferase